MSRYNQGWSQVREMLKQKTETMRVRQIIVKIVSGLLSAVLAGMVLFSLMGCATTSPIAVKGELQELGQPATLTSLVQVAQMGGDCTSQDRKLKGVLLSIMASQGAPVPQKIAVKALAGSSLCGFSQGTANETGTLELGARNTARAEITMYWSDITYSQLQKAQAVLTSLRPIAAASKVAHTPAK